MPAAAISLLDEALREDRLRRLALLFAHEHSELMARFAAVLQGGRPSVEDHAGESPA
jgi:hypothetical protein